MSGRWLKVAVLLLAMLGAGSALAGSRIVLGLHFGVPLYGPVYPYYPPYYYYPPPVYYYPPPPSVIYAPPPTIENRPAASQESYWYYCAESRGYYPYVRDCPGGWERVPPSPPPGK